MPKGISTTIIIIIAISVVVSALSLQSSKINFQIPTGIIQEKPTTIQPTIENPKTVQEIPIKQPPEQSPIEEFPPKSTLETAVIKKSPIFDIPCTSNPNPVFQHSFAKLEDIANIIPPGEAAGEEIKPHSYVDIATESIPLYAPADMELVEGAYYSEPPTFKCPVVIFCIFKSAARLF